MNKLKIAQINLQRIKTATSDLINYLIEQKYSIACPQDCAVTSRRPHGLPSSIPYFMLQNLTIVILLY